MTVDIPPSHRLTIDVSREIPAGRTIVAFTPAPMDETEYLLRSPNGEILLNSTENANKGTNIISFETIEDAIKAVTAPVLGLGA
jgi:hypothetical protein